MKTKLVLLLMLLSTVGYTAARITNSDISSSAAIAFSKMATLTGDRALMTTQAGVVAVSSDITVAELGRLDGVTSNIQTQLDAKQATDTDLDALAAVSSTGLIARTGSGTAAARTLTGPAAGLTVSNGDGVSGNPTLALADDLAALEALSGTNTLYYRSGTSAWTGVTISGDLSFSGGTLGNASPTTSAIASTVIDWSTLGIRGGVYTKSISSTTTDFTFANQVAGMTIVVKMTQTTGDPRWPAGILWASGTTPDATNPGTDVYTFIYDGSNTIGNAVLDVRAP